MLLWGGFKFTALEAEGIRPLIEHSPLLRWLYPGLGVRGASALIGVVELTAALITAPAVLGIAGATLAPSTLSWDRVIVLLRRLHPAPAATRSEGQVPEGVAS